MTETRKLGLRLVLWVASVLLRMDGMDQAELADLDALRTKLHVGLGRGL